MRSARHSTGAQMSVQNLLDLGGRIAIVTGGSRGIGLQMAKALGEMGAKVAITARRQDELDEARAHLERAGIDCLTFAGDLADSRRSRASSTPCSPRWGRIDILVNNAGCNWAAPAEDYPDEGWRKVMSLNVDAQFFLSPRSRPALDDPAPQRQDRQHRVDRRALRQSAGVGHAHDGLQHEQGRAHQHDARARRRVGPAQHQRQRDLPGILPVEDDEGHARPHRRERARADAARAGWAATRTSRAASCSWRPKRRATSPARPSRSTAAARHLNHARDTEPAPERRRQSRRHARRCAVHPFDTTALAAYLRAHVDDFAGDLVVEQFQGGQSNPTYRSPRATGATCAAQAAGHAAAVRARGGARVPRDVRARRHRRAGGEDLRAVRGRRGDRHRLLRDGIRRGPHPLGSGAARHDAARNAPRTTTSSIASSPRCTASTTPPSASPTTAGPATTSQRQVARWSKQYQAAPRRPDPGDGPADRVAAASTCRPGDETSHRPRRLPDRQRDLPSDRAARAGGARLGAVDARPPAVGFRVPGDGVAAHAGASSAGLKGCDFARAGHPDRGRVRRRVLPPHRPRGDPALGGLPHLQHVPDRRDPARRARARAAGQCRERERRRDRRPRAARRRRRPGRWRSAWTPAALRGSGPRRWERSPNSCKD